MFLGITFIVPKGGSFPLPLKYIDAVRRTHTTLDVLLESQIDDRWNVDGDRDLSGAMERLHSHFTRLKKKSQKGYTWPRERLTRVQSNIQARLFDGQKCGQLCNLDNARRRRAFITLTWTTWSSRTPCNVREES